MKKYLVHYLSVFIAAVILIATAVPNISGSVAKSLPHFGLGCVMLGFLMAMLLTDKFSRPHSEK